jgi:hypothetical protein
LGINAKLNQTDLLTNKFELKPGADKCVFDVKLNNNESDHTEKKDLLQSVSSETFADPD